MKSSIIISLLIISVFCEDKLFFAFTHFRHGARAPIFPSENPVDDYGMTWNTPGELTAGGHRMHYLLGAYNRKRYIPSLLSDTYDPHEIYVISSNYNRTIQSALSQLQGLYPADETIELNEIQKKYSVPDLPKQDIDNIQETITKLGNAALPYHMRLIGVHIFEDAKMRYRNFENPKCKQKALDTMKQNIDNDIIVDRLKTFNEKWSKSFDKFFKDDKAKKYDYETLEKLADLFITDISEGFDFKEFLEKTELEAGNLTELYEFFVEFVGRTMNNYQYGDKEHKLIKLDMSSLFKELIEFIKKRINREADIQENKKINVQDYSAPKLVMVSGHDSMVSVMQLFLGLMYGDRNKFWHVPGYAANIAFEVFNTQENFSRTNYSQYKIRFLFNGTFVEEFQFDEFINKVEATAWNEKDIAQFCGYDQEGEKGGDTPTGTTEPEKETNVLAIVLGITTGIFFLLCIVFIILWRKKSSTSSTTVENYPLVDKENV